MIEPGSGICVFSPGRRPTVTVAIGDDGVVGADTDHGLAAAVNDLAERVPHDLVVTRGPDRPAVARMNTRWYTVAPPRLAAVD